MAGKVDGKEKACKSEEEEEEEKIVSDAIFLKNLPLSCGAVQTCAAMSGRRRFLRLASPS